MTMGNEKATSDDVMKPTARGFEPLRAEPNGFLVHHLNHSVTLSCLWIWVSDHDCGFYGLQWDVFKTVNHAIFLSFELLSHAMETALRCHSKKRQHPAISNRQRGDLNPCGQSPMDFESITLTTRSHCHVWQCHELSPMFVKLLKHNMNADLADVVLRLLISHGNLIDWELLGWAIR